MLYVTMTDKFLSGWGHCEGRINKLILECETREEADIVASNAKARGDMKYINIVYNKPYYSSRRYLAQYVSKEDYANWYKPGFFKGER